MEWNKNDGKHDHENISEVKSEYKRGKYLSQIILGLFLSRLNLAAAAAVLLVVYHIYYV